MNELLKVFLKIAIGVLTGFFLRRNRVIDERTQGNLCNLLMMAVLPLAILASSQYEYSAEMARSILAVGLGSLAYYIIMLIVMIPVIRHSGMEEQVGRVFYTASVFGNSAFVGVPIMGWVFGQSGLLLAAVFNLVTNLFFFSFGVRHLSSGKHSIKDLFINNVSAASVFAIVLFCIPFRFPTVVLDTMNFIGDVSFPLSMIILGSMLAVTDRKKLFCDGKSYIVVLLRMIVFPLLMLFALLAISRLVPISNPTIFTLVIMAALPCGTMNAIFSEKYNCAPKFCARTVVLSQIMMLITLPLILYLCMRLFGL